MPRRTQQTLQGWPTRALWVALATLLLVLPVYSDAITDCFESLSFDLCTVQDASGECPERFQQPQFADPVYRRQLFNYLIEQYVTTEVGVTPSWVLSMALSASDTTYATYLDGTYGTACATDAGITAILNASVTPFGAELSRQTWILLMQQASFCTDNEIFVMGQGCACKEDKDCNDGTGSAHVMFSRAVAVLAVVLLLWVGWGIANNHRQASAVGAQQMAVQGTCNVLYTIASKAPPARVGGYEPVPTVDRPHVELRKAAPPKPAPQQRPVHQKPPPRREAEAPQAAPPQRFNVVTPPTQPTPSPTTGDW